MYSKVIATCKELHSVYGDNTFQLLTSKAKNLQANGKVKILSDSDQINNTELNRQAQQSQTINTNTKNVSNKIDTPEYVLRNKWQDCHDKIRIAYVQDFSKIGGAELSNINVVNVGERLGFDIVGVTPNNFKSNILKSSDIIIVNNIFEFSKEQYHEILYNLFERRIPYIKYDHDFREIKRIDKTRQLFELSKENIFISELHRKKYNELFINGEVLPLCVDTEYLIGVKNKVKEKKNICIYPSYHKGVDNHNKYILQNKDIQHLLILQNGGISSEIKNLSNVNIMTKKSYTDIINLMSECTRLVHLPGICWAGERILLEAKILGLEVISNSNSGHNDIIEREGISVLDKLVAELNQAPLNFWKIVKRSL